MERNIKTYVQATIVSLFFFTSAYAQNIVVSGTVVDENKVALPGVTVQAKGTGQGTITGVNGKYSLSVPSNASLLFKFVGYETQEILIEGRRTVDVAMGEGLQSLNELVVTALGIERTRESVSYAVSELNGSDVAEKGESDMIRALSGKIAGVNVSGAGGASGSSTNITIRGSNSATGNNQPLFVVDGIPFDNTLVNTSSPGEVASTYSNRALDLDPNDIESMTVLKGGAAAALYGSRAANGVILITTKSGKRGEGLSVSVSLGTKLIQIAKYPDYQNQYGQGTYGNFSSSATESFGPAFSDIDGLMQQEDIIMNNGVPYYKNHLDEQVPYKSFPNNVSDFYQNGIGYEQSVNISGGGKTRFNITASNLDEDGFIPYTKLGRTSIKVGANSSVTKNFQVGGALTYVNTRQRGVLSGGHGTLTTINRQTLFIPRSYDLTGFEYEDPVTGEQKKYSFWDNPYYIAKNGPYTSNVDRVYGNLNAQLDINRWMKLGYKVGFNTYVDKREQVLPAYTYDFPNGAFQQHNLFFKELESNLTLTGAQPVTSKINLKYVIGQNYNEVLLDQNKVQGDKIISKNISRITNTQVQLSLPANYSLRKLVGVYADVALSYESLLYWNITLRNDWSSTLPENKRRFLYPSTSLAFVFSELLDKASFIDLGKLRLAIARIGNDATPYLLQTVHQVNSSASGIGQPFNGVDGLSIGNNLGNDEIGPEFTNEFEVGLELNLFDNKLTIDVAYYNKVTSDQIFRARVPISSGYTTRTLNAGEIQNQGVEVALGITPFAEKDWSWNIFTTFAANRSEVLSLYGDLKELELAGGNSYYGNFHIVGQPYGLLKGEVTIKDEEGNLLLNPSNGLPTKSSSYHVVGDPNPDFIAGISNSFRYKNLELSVLFDWKQGGDLLTTSLGYLRGFGLTEETARDRERTYILPGFLADPEDSKKPLLDANGNKIRNNIQISPQDYWSAALSGNQRNQYRFAAESYIFDATVFRLREMTLTYRLPRKWFESIVLKGASLILTARNIWFYAPNLPHIDPEVSTYGAGNLAGAEQYAPPTTRSFGFNLKIYY